jgi:hypothetical protein
MSALAEAPLRRRTLERTGMTPEQELELELLISEQEADDTYFVRKPVGEVSLDRPALSSGFIERYSGDPTFFDFVGIEYDFDSFGPHAQGQFVDFLPRERESLFAVGVKHGVRSTYTNLKCRCTPCRAANSAFIRERRADAKAKAKRAEA